MKHDDADNEAKMLEIIKQIALAAHEFSKSRTRVLSSLLNRPSPEPAPSAEPRSSRWPFSDFKGDPYISRLFRRQKGETAQHVPPFAKDYARIVHSPSFRRLQGKTQLIPSGENYFFRTRLTHSLEVADIATRIARRLNGKRCLNGYKIELELVASAALLHDIGHPPFGHSGEETLNALMRDFGGFEGNAQTLRLVTREESANPPAVSRNHHRGEHRGNQCRFRRKAAFHVSAEV